MRQTKQQAGFSLIEIMLVIVIMTTLAMMALSITQTKIIDARIERTADQMQQIMQAATSYYIDTHGWPRSSGDEPSSIGAMQQLIEGGYLPVMAQDGDTKTFPTPWGLDPGTKDTAGGYAISVTEVSVGGKQVPRLFQVTVTLPNESYATVLKGKLPLAEVREAPSSDPKAKLKHYTLTASINVPGYDYAHAKAVNYADIVGHGECVPAPACPDGMSPHIYASSATFAGFTDDDLDNNVAANVQSLFVGAKGGVNGAPVPNPPACEIPGSSKLDTKHSPACKQDPGDTFWRICITGHTSQGVIYDHSTGEGANKSHSLNATVVTKCVQPRI